MKSFSISITMLLLFMACKKDYSVEKVQQHKPTPPSAFTTTIITIGSGIDHTNIERALYWKDSIFFYVEPLATDHTHASTAAIWNNNLIIGGEVWSTSFSSACYWVNGQRHILSDNARNYHTTLDSKVYNNALYILVKDDNGRAVIHKITNVNGSAKAIRLNISIPINISPSSFIVATNMALDNNKLIIFGSYRNTANNNQPCLWEVDSLDQVTPIFIPENSSTNFRVFRGDAFKGILYVAGEVSASSGMVTTPYIIWNRAGKYTELQTAKATSSTAGLWKRLNFKIDYTGNAYLLHTTPYPFNADVYSVNVQKQVVHNCSFAKGTYGFGIDILGEEYAFGIGYAPNLAGEKTSNYWGVIEKKNQSISLKTPHNVTFIVLSGVYIFPQ